MKATKVFNGHGEEMLSVTPWPPASGAIVDNGCDEVYLRQEECEAVGAHLIALSGMCGGKRNFPCNSGDGSELSPRYSGAGNISMIPTCYDGSVRGEVILTPQDAMALAFELIRMATHE